MQNQLSLETQILIKKIASALAVVVLLSVLTWLALTNARVNSRDIQRLSAIRMLQADLKLYFFKNNVFPVSILDKNSLENPEKECFRNLCLNGLPADPLTGVSYKYTPCKDASSLECEDGISDPMGFKIEYSLEGNNQPLSSGSQRATVDKIIR